MLDARYHRIGGEDDGHGTAQADPRDVKLPFERECLVRQEAEEDTQRTGEDYHEHPDEHADARHWQQFVGIDQEAEDDEHHDLPQPDETVEEGGDALLVDQGGVPHLQAGDVSGQVAVSVAKGYGGKGEEGKRHN